jgi:DNA polymerase-3 subunit epsilon
MREIVIDTETTGLDFDAGDRIIEIGCVEIIDKVITGRTFHRYINPKIDLSAESIEITGLTNEFLSRFDTFCKIIDDFLDFIQKDRLVIHNAKFDVSFIDGELKFCRGMTLNNEVIDTLALAKEKYPGSHATLDALCKKFSVSTDSRTKHGALVDAKLLAEVYLMLSVEKVQATLFDTKVKNIDMQSYSTEYLNSIKPRIFPLSAHEHSLHLEFLKTIENPVWNSIESD